MAPKIIRNDEAVSSIPSPVDQSGIASISLSVCHLPFPSRPWSILEVSKGMECAEEFGSYIHFVHEGMTRERGVSRLATPLSV